MHRCTLWLPAKRVIGDYSSPLVRNAWKSRQVHDLPGNPNLPEVGHSYKLWVASHININHVFLVYTICKLHYTILILSTNQYQSSWINPHYHRESIEVIIIRQINMDHYQSIIINQSLSLIITQSLSIGQYQSRPYTFITLYLISIRYPSLSQYISRIHYHHVVKAQCSNHNHVA